jgi:hypothetical protein
MSLAVQGVFNKGTVDRQIRSATETRISRAQRGFPSSGSAPWGRILLNSEDIAAKGEVLARWKNDKGVAEYVKRIAQWRLGKKWTWEAIATRLSQDEEFRTLYWGAWRGMNAHKGKLHQPMPKVSHLANSVRRHVLHDTGSVWIQTFNKKRGKVLLPESRWTNVQVKVPELLPSGSSSLGARFRTRDGGQGTRASIPAQSDLQVRQLRQRAQCAHPYA